MVHKYEVDLAVFWNIALSIHKLSTERVHCCVKNVIIRLLNWETKEVLKANTLHWNVLETCQAANEVVSTVHCIHIRYESIAALCKLPFS